jgi:hypothetical protein
VSAFDGRPPKQLRTAFFATHHLALSPHRHPLLTIRNLTLRNIDRMFEHERDYSEENRFRRAARRSIREKDSEQRKVEKKLDHPPVVPRVSPHLLCEGTQVGVCGRSTVFCDNRGDLSVANSCSRRRIARVFAARTKLIVRVCSRRQMPAWILSFRTGNVLRTKRSTWFLSTRKSRQQAHRV